MSNTWATLNRLRKKNAQFAEALKVAELTEVTRKSARARALLA
jgi:hypothetical protein